MEVFLVVLAAIVLALIVFAVAKKGRDRRLDKNREEAGQIRRTARRHGLEAERRQARAEEQAARAREDAATAEEEADRARSARERALEQERRARELDPDADAEPGDGSSGRDGSVTERGTVEHGSARGRADRSH